MDVPGIKSARRCGKDCRGNQKGREALVLQNKGRKVLLRNRKWEKVEKQDRKMGKRKTKKEALENWKLQSASTEISVRVLIK